MPDEASPMMIWAVSDGRAGIEAQVVGLAEAVARRRRSRIIVKRIEWRNGLAPLLPADLNLAPRRWATPGSGMRPPWPDLWIAAGRASLPFSVRMKRWSRRRTFVVQVQHPRLAPERFDLVIPPEHDGLTGPNVTPILGSPHRLTAKRLANDYEAFGAQIDPLPHPRVAVLIGGRSKAHDLTPERASATARDIELALTKDGGSLMMTFSRRTPEAAQDILAARLRHLPGIIWQGEGPNPYFAFLAGADYILVTEDSTNLAVEAAATGKPVFVLKMDGDSRKLRAFHESLERRGVSRPFEGFLHPWSYPPLDETDRAADEIVTRMLATAG